MIERDLQFNRGEITSGEIARGLGVGYRRLVADTLSKVLFSDSHVLSFFDSPKGHEGSHALYLAEEMVGKDMIFVSFLGPNGKTSTHKHEKPIQEHYLQLVGSSYLRLGSDCHELKGGSAFIVPSDVPHQLTTRDNSSLVLIVMENAISVPRDKLHIPVGVQ